VTGSSGFLHLSWNPDGQPSNLSSLRLDHESSALQPVDSILEARPGAWALLRAQAFAAQDI
jgi:hypothetical protein